MWLNILIIVVLLVISYQDFRDRLIHWFYFPITAVLLIIKLILENAGISRLYMLIDNYCIIILMLVLTTLIYSIKFKKFTLIIDKLIGAADILMFGLIALSFSSVNLVIFLIVSFIFSLIFQLIYLILFKQTIQIPLAGIVSGLFIVCLIFESFELFDLKNQLFIHFFLEKFIFQ